MLPPAVFINWNLANSELNAWMNGTTIEGGRFIITVLISFILIALMIVVGIWIPARKAMKVQPAEAFNSLFARFQLIKTAGIVAITNSSNPSTNWRTKTLWSVPPKDFIKAISPRRC